MNWDSRECERKEGSALSQSPPGLCSSGFEVNAGGGYDDDDNNNGEEE